MSSSTARRTLAPVVVAALLVPLLVVAPAAGAATFVEGVGSTENMLLVVDGDGTVVGTYPSELLLLFEYAKFYGDEYVNASVRYSVRECRASWGAPIPQVAFYVPDVDGVMKIESPTLDVACHADALDRVEGNTTLTSAGVAVRVTARFGVRIVRLGNKDVTVLRIGEYVVRYALLHALPSVAYYVTVEKEVNGQRYYDAYSEWLFLDPSNVEVSLYVIELWLNRISLSAYVERGNFTTGGVTLSPVYEVEICGRLGGPYRGSMPVIVTLSDTEVVLLVRSSATECKTVANVALAPGSNQTLVLSARSGAFSLTLKYERLSIVGLTVSIGRPFGRVIASGSLWTCVVQSIISLSGYYSPFPTVSASGTVSNRFFGTFECGPLSMVGEGVYTLLCEKTISGEFDPWEVENSNFRVTVSYTDERGEVWTYEAEVRVVVTDPSTIAGQVSQAYSTALNVLLMGIVATVVLLLVSYLKDLMTGAPLIDLHILRGTLLALVVSYTVLSVGIPAVYYAFSKIVENLPILSKYITPPTSTDPKVVFGHMLSYYDNLYSAIMRDYEVEFVGSIGKIMGWLQSTAIAAVAFMLIALALSTIWTPGAGIPFSSIFSGAMSLIFGVISMLMMQVQMGVFAVMAVTIARIMIFVVTAIILSLLVLGVVLICVPSSTTQRIGEDLFGAGVLYMIVFPLVAPLSYAIYMHLMDTIRTQGVLDTVGNICIFVPFPICFIGLVPFLTRMIAFVVASGVATLLILGSLGYILTRTGVAAGLGEALSSLVWRG